MNCAQCDRLLDLDDFDRSPPLRALARHLDRCSRCRRRHPDVGWLLGSRPAPTRRPLRAAAALLVAVAAWSALWRGDSGSPEAVDGLSEWAAEVSAPDTRATPPAATRRCAYRVEEVAVARHRGRRVASSVTYEVWTPERPRCLDWSPRP